MKKHGLLSLVTLSVYVFLLGPLAVIVAAAFSDTNALVFPGRGFTLRWFVNVLTQPAFLHAAKLSLLVALAGTGAALALGVPAAYALSRYPVKGRNAVKTLFLSPVLIPNIVLGFVLLRYIMVRFALPVLPALLLGHTLLSLPYVMRMMAASLASFDFAEEEAARSLGAGRGYAFFHIVLPGIRSGLMSALIMSVINSFNNVALSAFLTGPGMNLLPMEIMAYVEYHFDPTIAALAAMMMATTLGVMLLIEKTLGLKTVM